MSTLLLRRGRLHDRADLVDLFIADGKIASIGAPPAGRPPSQVVDLEGRLVVPGFVNAHTHLDKAFLAETATEAVRYDKGVLSGPLLEAKRRATVEEIRTRARRALSWAVRTGSTAIRSHLDIDPAHELKAVRALLQLREEFAGLVDLQLVAFPQEGVVDSPETVDLLREALRLGVDLIGGKPSADQDFKAHIDTVFGLALEFGRDVDIHVDTDLETDYTRSVSRHADGVEYPDELEVVHLAELAIRHGYQGRVVASHLCALDHCPPELAANVIHLLRKAGVGVVACPSVALYIMGRHDTHDVRRGIAPVRKLRAGGVPTAFGTDNLGDAFNVYATPDLLTHFLLTALGCHFRTVDDLGIVLEMATTIPAGLMRLPEHGLAPGRWADLVVIDAESLYEAVTMLPVRSYVFKRGVMTAVGRSWSTLFGPTGEPSARV